MGVQGDEAVDPLELVVTQLSRDHGQLFLHEGVGEGMVSCSCMREGGKESVWVIMGNQFGSSKGDIR